MSITSRVRATSKSFVGDVEIQHQTHRTQRIRVTVRRSTRCPHITDPTPRHLLSFIPMGCVKEVSDLINHPVVSLFGSGMDNTGANMIDKSIKGIFFATTSREW